MSNLVVNDQSGKEDVKINKPEISIIVPVYKVEQYLNRCVESILNQNFENFELILVNDGSPDNCPQICEAWGRKDRRIRVIHQKNSGAGAARNTGLKVAQGRYIGFVDADDYVAKEMYQYLYDLLRKYPTAQLAQCDNIKQSKITARIIQPEEKVEVFDKTRMLNAFFRVNGEADKTGIWNKLIDVRILDGFAFSNTINEDVEASYELYTRSNVMVNSNQKYYHYFINTEGVTRTKFCDKDLAYLEICDRILERTKREYPSYTQYAELRRRRANFTLLSKMLLRGYDRREKKFVELKKELRCKVRRDFWVLFMSKMPVSRKLLLILVCLI